MNLSLVFRRLILAEIEALPPTRTGRPVAISSSLALDYIFKVLRTGMQWREVDAPVAYTTIFRRFQTWSSSDVFCRAYTRALRTYRRLHPTKYYCIDSSYTKNRFGQIGMGRNHTDRGRKALKLSIVTDQNGVSYAARTDPGNRPDVTLLSASLDAMLLDMERVSLFADRGYDSRNNRRICIEAGLTDRIFRRRTKTVRRTNAKRIVVEHAFAWLNGFRRLLLCYEQTPSVYLSFVFLAMGQHLCSRFLNQISI